MVHDLSMQVGDTKFKTKLAFFGLNEAAIMNSDYIYSFWETQGIGESSLGAALDAAAKGKGVFAHRMYGHNLAYNFPITNPEQIPDFLEHVLVSDSTTKGGINVIPGEMLEDTGLLNYFNSPHAHSNWGLVTVGDSIIGIISIYTGYKNLKSSFQGKLVIPLFLGS